MVESFATDVSQHMRNSAHQFRKLAMCRHQREMLKGSVAGSSWRKITSVVNEIKEVPECMCALCKKDRCEYTGWETRGLSQLAICDGRDQSDSQGSVVSDGDGGGAGDSWSCDALDKIRQKVEPGRGP